MRFCVFLFYGVCLFSQAGGAAELSKIFIDPGHGGKDHGAVLGSMKESDITFQVSQKLFELLKKSGRFEPILSHQKDEFMSLEDRVQRAQEAKADLLLSVHANWSKESTAHGVEFYFQNQLPPDEEAMFLAHRENLALHPAHAKKYENSRLTFGTQDLEPEVGLILQDLNRSQQIFKSSQLAMSLKKNWQGMKKSRNHTIQQAPFFVISRLDIPAVLVEIGFLSHPVEGVALATDSYQRWIARHLFQGLLQYHESLDKRP